MTMMDSIVVFLSSNPGKILAIFERDASKRMMLRSHFRACGISTHTVCDDERADDVVGVVHRCSGCMAYRFIPSDEIKKDYCTADRSEDYMTISCNNECKPDLYDPGDPESWLKPGSDGFRVFKRVHRCNSLLAGLYFNAEPKYNRITLDREDIFHPEIDMEEYPEESLRVFEAPAPFLKKERWESFFKTSDKALLSRALEPRGRSPPS